MPVRLSSSPFCTMVLTNWTFLPFAIRSLYSLPETIRTSPSTRTWRTSVFASTIASATAPSRP